MAQATDGTQLNPGLAGDLVSDEDMTGLVRQSPDVPQLGAANAAYKNERTKIALGNYGQDRGDASNDGGRAFPVELQTERRILETQMLMHRAQQDAVALVTRKSERQPPFYFMRTGRDGRV